MKCTVMSAAGSYPKYMYMYIFTLHFNPENLRVKEKFYTEILRIKWSVHTTLFRAKKLSGLTNPKLA